MPLKLKRALKAAEEVAEGAVGDAAKPERQRYSFEKPSDVEW